MLKVTNLEVFYNRSQAVFGIDFNVPEGQIISLIGSNGAGKTSTLQALLNIPRRAGLIEFAGFDTARHSTATLVQKGLCLVPEGRRVFANLSVDENLTMGGFFNHDNFAHMKQTCYELFPRLADKRRAYAGTLSGGEAQMLAIARALMGEPRVLMLDEPSLGLAPKITAEVFSIIRRLKAEGITILLVEQNARLALGCSDFAYVLEHGRITLSGPGAELAADARVVAKYLGGE